LQPTKVRPDPALRTPKALGAQPGERYLFWSGSGKLKSAIEGWRRSFTSLAKIANEGREFHRLQDTFAAELLLGGVPIEQISILLRHSSPRVN
jgi:hypothetical protein